MARSQSGNLIDVCTGLRVDLPVLQPVAGAASGLLGGLLDPVLNGIVGDVNLNLRDALSGRNIGLSIRDQNGNLVSLPGSCKLKADSVTVEGPGGIAIGGGEISGLGSTASAKASAADPNAIAFGHGAMTSGTATGAIAIGLRGAVTAADGVAIGRDSTVSAAGGIALGAGSVALRGGLAGSTEAFSGTAVASAQGALSIGSAGNERQITHVAGGTQDTDAVNLRQLRSVANSSASALGGGAGFDANGTFTGPRYALRSGVYTDVGTALTALDQRIDDVAAYAREGRREARQGVAAAMAMTAASMPSQPGKTSWSGNTATFKGEWAAGFAVAHRLDVAFPVAINAGLSLAGNGFGGARFGMSGEF
jgi:hypothetical protein